MRKTKIRQTYRLKVSLRHTSPPVWRRFEVSGSYSLHQLHNVLQTVMGWDDCHLYVFLAKGKEYMAPDPENSSEVLNARRSSLSDIAGKKGDRFEYVYDFGDEWEHQLTVESILPAPPGGRTPRCLAGKRNCPPEDVGGPYGYATYLKAVADPDHSEHEEFLGWLDSFDPERFSVEEVNRQLEKQSRSVQ